MYNLVEKISTNIAGKQKKKNQIILTHTSTGTTPSVRDAINDAITAVPG